MKSRAKREWKPGKSPLKRRRFSELFKDIVERLIGAHLHRKLQQHEKRLKLDLEVTNDGLWDVNLQTSETYFSPCWQTILGFAPGEVEPHSRSWETRLHPDD